MDSEEPQEMDEEEEPQEIEVDLAKNQEVNSKDLFIHSTNSH